jgi:dynein heavy chain
VPSQWDRGPPGRRIGRYHGGRKGGLRQAFCDQVTQLTRMLDSLLEGEIEDLDLLECFFLEALYCSLGSSLLEEGRVKFDECIKRLSSMPTVDSEGNWARPGELPGRN